MFPLFRYLKLENYLGSSDVTSFFGGSGWNLLEFSLAQPFDHYSYLPTMLDGLGQSREDYEHILFIKDPLRVL